MTVQFIRLASQGLPAGAIRILPPATEAALVADGEAIYTTVPNPAGDDLPVRFDPTTGMIVMSDGGPIAAKVALQGVVSGGGITPTMRQLIDGNSPPVHWGASIVAADWAISSGSPTVTQETRNGRQCLKIVTGVGVTANVDLTLIGDTSFFGRLFALVEGDKASNVNQLGFLVSPDNFTNYAQAIYTTRTAPLNSSVEQGGAYTIRIDGQETAAGPTNQFQGFGAAWSVTNPTKDGTQTVTKIRFRVIPVGGQSGVAYLYAVSLAPRRRAGRFFVTVDDGYKSFINLALPIFQARGIPITMSVISNLIGDRVSVNNYINWDDCRQIIAAGGQIVTHGPASLSGSGNIIANYSNNADRIADMAYMRDLIVQNGCETPNFEKVYIWPQGQFQSASGDTSTLDAAIAAGFTVGRGVGLTSLITEFSSNSKYMRLAVPVMGHSYAGGSEAANISRITTYIAAVGQARGDAVLELHKCVKNGDTPDAVGITIGNLITIADAMVAERTAGRMAFGVMGDLAEPTWWAA